MHEVSMLHILVSAHYCPFDLEDVEWYSAVSSMVAAEVYLYILWILMVCYFVYFKAGCLSLSLLASFLAFSLNVV